MIDSLPSGCSLLGVDDSRSNLFNVSSTCNVMDDLFSSSMSVLFAGGLSRDGESLNFGCHLARSDPARPQPARNTNHYESESPNERADCGGDAHAAAQQQVQPTPSTLSSTQSSKTPLPTAPAGPTAAASLSAAGKAAADGHRAPRGSPDGGGGGGGGRAQGTWTAAENCRFFEALRAHGRAFDLLYGAVKGGKTREQVAPPFASCARTGVARAPVLRVRARSGFFKALERCGAPTTLAPPDTAQTWTRGEAWRKGSAEQRRFGRLVLTRHS